MGTAEEEDSINIVSTVIRVWEIGPGSGGIRWECGAWWRAGWGEIKNILMYQNTGTGLGSSAGGLSSEHL